MFDPEIGFLNSLVRVDAGGAAAQGYSPRFKNVGAIGNSKSGLRVLLHQKNCQPAIIDPAFRIDLVNINLRRPFLRIDEKGSAPVTDKTAPSVICADALSVPATMIARLAATAPDVRRIPNIVT